ncbi:hypothetical protein B484DRAFT_449893 [Ochromonadaceae sp. CCMP2298]|nr:hypothetical protein B484DRAFT_449893 [Ochromonadaceae sp. CCMP2298]
MKCAVALLLLSWHVGSYQSFTFSTLRAGHARRGSSLLASDDDDGKEKPARKKSTKFDRIIDDFVGKKYGAGEAFYGKRTSGLSEDEYDLLRAQGGKKNKETMEDYDSKPMRSNAVLLVGNPLEGVLQWIALELLEKGFSVRLAVENRAKAAEELGLPGYNLDIVELGPNSEEYAYARAVQDCQAVIFCSSFDPVPSPFLAKTAVSFSVAKSLLNIVLRAREAKVGDVEKVSVVSRHIPSVAATQDSLLSVVAGTAASIANSYFTGIVNALEPVYSDFRKLHEQFEQQVRESGIEYVVVRAPPLVKYARPGAVDAMAALSSQDISTLQQRGEGLSLTIGALDLAEAAVQSLLLEEIERVSFTICARSATSADTATRASPAPAGAASPADQGSMRVSRQTYYGILSMDDTTDPGEDPKEADKAEQKRLLDEEETANSLTYKDMRSTYLIRPPDAFSSQIEEDQAVEQYWRSLLTNLRKDA